MLKLTPVSILNYVPYNKEEVKKLIQEKLDWRDYGGKHYESVFTKFYQAYILPEKFHIDKRKPHLSTLICSGQMTRQEAISMLEQPLYEGRQLRDDKEYVLKKFGLGPDEFEAILNTPPRKHEDYKTDRIMKARYMNLLRRTQRFRNVLKGKVSE